MSRTERITRRKVLKVAGAGAALGTAGAFPAPALWAQGKSAVIKLGNVNSMSGAFARYGQEIQRGVDIAINSVNQKGVAVGGTAYRIEQQVYDDKTDATTAAKLVERAVTSDGANIVIASLGSVIVKACIPVAQRLQFPMMTHWAQIDGVFAGQKGNAFLYGAMPPFSLNYTAICEMAATFDHPKLKTAAMITANDELGVFSANDYFPSDLKKARIEYLGAEFFPPKTQEYAPALERLQRKNPDLLLINCYAPDIVGIFKEMQSTKWFPPMIAVEAPTKLAEGIGDGVDGVFVPAFWDPGLNTTKDAFIGTSKDFTALYKARYKEDPPDFVAACGAMNVIVYASVLEAAGSVTDPGKINGAFRAFDGEVFFSKVKFDDTGLNRKGSVYPSQFQKGRPVIVYPPSLAQAAPIHPYPGYRKG